MKLCINQINPITYQIKLCTNQMKQLFNQLKLSTYQMKLIFHTNETSFQSNETHWYTKLVITVTSSRSPYYFHPHRLHQLFMLSTTFRTRSFLLNAAPPIFLL
uniref:Uncharacterized protein n=1 Tax=Lygus hesperus TaxID=30085 RepID=A0A146LFA1_LYGHE